MTDSPVVGLFVDHRNLLFTVAYEMLGSAADAEDVLQEAWLRWSEADHAEVRDARAYLVRIVTRLALNRLRTMQRRRETYVGPWLPEPLITAPDVADDLELADSVSTAMLLVLETMSPTERAVFCLREVFGFDYDEIAESVGKSSAAVRQIAHRARAHVAERRPRQPVDPTEQRQVIERFLAASATGHIQSLMDVLAPDVVLVTDGGGINKAALRPILGREKAIRFLDAVATGPFDAEVRWINGALGLVMEQSGERLVVTMLVEDGLVTGLYALSNPEKLARVGEVLTLER